MLLHSVYVLAFKVAPLHSHYSYCSASAPADDPWHVLQVHCINWELPPVLLGVLNSDAESRFAMQETLDPALTRPGRFDRRVAVPMPDVRGRLEILEHYLKVPD